MNPAGPSLQSSPALQVSPATKSALTRSCQGWAGLKLAGLTHAAYPTMEWKTVFSRALPSELEEELLWLGLVSLRSAAAVMRLKYSERCMLLRTLLMTLGRKEEGASCQSITCAHMLACDLHAGRCSLDMNSPPCGLNNILADGF